MAAWVAAEAVFLALAAVFAIMLFIKIGVLDTPVVTAWNRSCISLTTFKAKVAVITFGSAAEKDTAAAFTQMVGLFKRGVLYTQTTAAASIFGIVDTAVHTQSTCFTEITMGTNGLTTLGAKVFFPFLTMDTHAAYTVLIFGIEKAAILTETAFLIFAEILALAGKSTAALRTKMFWIRKV